MIVQLFVFACVCALGVTENTPQYSEALKNVLELSNILKKNVLSVDGNIPLLNDPKRHYIEIVNVINDEGLSQSGCLWEDYSESYQKNVNRSATQAIAKPQEVVDTVKKIIKKVKEGTDEIVGLLNKCTKHAIGCNKEVHAAVQADPDVLGIQASLLLNAGLASAKLSAKNKKFLYVSNNLAAHSYVIQGAAELKDVALAVAEVHRSLNILRTC